MVSNRQICSSLYDILKCLDTLAKHSHFTRFADVNVGYLKASVWFVKFLVKGEIELDPDDLFFTEIESWAEDTKIHLFQVIRNGIITSGSLDQTLINSRQNFEPLKRKCTHYFGIYFKHSFYSPIINGHVVVIAELLQEWLDPSLENLRYVRRFGALDLSDWMKEQISYLERMVRFIRNYLIVIESYMKEEMKKQGMEERIGNLLIDIQVFIQNVMFASYSFWLEDVDARTTLGRKLFDLLAKIKKVERDIKTNYVQFFSPSKAAAYPLFLEIDVRALIAVSSLVADLEDMLNIDDQRLVKELWYMVYFLFEPHLNLYTSNEHEKINTLLIQVEIIARKLGASVIHSVNVLTIGDDMNKERSPLVDDFLEIISLVKAENREIYLKFFRPSPLSLPRICTDFFLHNLDDSLKYSCLISSVKVEVLSLKKNLACLRFYHGKMRKQYLMAEEHEYVEQHVLDLAYEAECIVDLISSSVAPVCYHVLWLSDVLEKAKLFKVEVKNIYDQMELQVQRNIDSMGAVSSREIMRPDDLATNELQVGFKDEEAVITELLIRGSKQRSVVSVVGMPGLGKTTLAKRAFEGPSVLLHFHLRSWISISKEPRKRDMLVYILGNIIEFSNGMHQKSDEDLEDLLYKTLKGKRYLIVMDGIWNIEPWNKIDRSLPDDHNGSRILFTSRHRDVPLQVIRESAVHCLRLFTEDESWELLQKKVFPQEDCPTELSSIGKKIAKKCKGLPLSVVVVAGVLRRVDRNQAKWEEIAESLSKHILDDQQNCMDILELSYKHLPNKLKPCFLYFGMFFVAKEIPVQKLILLWIAEGFVLETNMESQESAAESYLADLADRSLVMISQSKSKGGVKACLIHDLLHEFCFAKARKENFLQLCRGISFSGGVDDPSMYVNNAYQHRLCFHSTRQDFCEHRSFHPYVRSLQFFSTNNIRYSNILDGHFNNISFIPYCMKLLRVLDLGEITVGYTFPTVLLSLLHLRYLSIRGDMNSIPPSICLLWRLETFLFKGLKGEVKVPDTLWEMARLKYVFIDDWATFKLPNCGPDEKSSTLGDMVTLSTPCLRHGDGTVDKITRRLPGLRKLKCIFLESLDYFGGLNQFPVLECLSNLEAIKVFYYGKVFDSCRFSLPATLKKLTLSKFCLPWSEISKIGRLLPNLEVLKLLLKAVEGDNWDVYDDEFLKLKFLKLDDLNICHLNASYDAFSCLEQLVLLRCKQLKYIPSHIGEITTLKRILVRWCSTSAADSAWEIMQEQLEMGNDGLKVVVHHQNYDIASSS